MRSARRSRGQVRVEPAELPCGVSSPLRPRRTAATRDRQRGVERVSCRNRGEPVEWPLDAAGGESAEFITIDDVVRLSRLSGGRGEVRTGLDRNGEAQ